MLMHLAQGMEQLLHTSLPAVLCGPGGGLVCGSGDGPGVGGSAVPKVSSEAEK